MRRLVFLFLLAALSVRADPLPPTDPVQQWHLDAETGMLWKFTGSATPLEYIFQPTFLTLVGRENFSWSFGGGDLVLRPRFALLIEPIVRGPEHHYFGGAASPLLEWWRHDRTACLFFTSGGGLGWLDARGYQIAGAQGQEFNLNWFIYGGGRVRLGERTAAGVGLYFQHVSNGHLDKVDPGVNALGPIASFRWRF